MITEYCPHCEQNVEIKAGFVKQKCPSCGANILPCSLCNNDEINCKDCLFVKNYESERDFVKTGGRK